MANWLSICNTIDELYNSYGVNFETSFPFAVEMFECARDMILNFRLKQLNDTAGNNMILSDMPDELQDLIDILLHCDKPFFTFVADMIRIKQHLHQLISDESSCREISNFGSLVDSLDRQGIEVKFTDSTDDNVTLLAKLMFWAPVSDESELLSLKLCVAKLKFESLDLPELKISNCFLHISQLLAWLCHNPDTKIPSIQLIQAFLFANTKLTELQSCLTTTQLVYKLFHRQLDVLFAIAVWQQRLANALKEISESVGVPRLDTTAPAERFVLIARLAAALGYEPGDTFKRYAAELQVTEYFKYGELGTLDIVFNKLSNDEYTWPLFLLGCVNEQDIMESRQIVTYVLEGVKSEVLRLRISSLLQECSIERNTELTFPQPVAPVETKIDLPTEPAVAEASLPTALEDITDKLSNIEFKIEEGGWDLDAIPE